MDERKQAIYEELLRRGVIGEDKRPLVDELARRGVIQPVTRDTAVMRGMDSPALRAAGTDAKRGVRPEYHYWRVRNNPKATQREIAWADEYKRRFGEPPVPPPTERDRFRPEYKHDVRQFIANAQAPIGPDAADAEQAQAEVAQRLAMARALPWYEKALLAPKAALHGAVSMIPNVLTPIGPETPESQAYRQAVEQLPVRERGIVLALEPATAYLQPDVARAAERQRAARSPWDIRNLPPAAANVVGEMVTDPLNAIGSVGRLGAAAFAGLAAKGGIEAMMQGRPYESLLSLLFAGMAGKHALTKPKASAGTSGRSVRGPSAKPPSDAALTRVQPSTVKEGVLLFDPVTGDAARVARVSASGDVVLTRGDKQAVVPRDVLDTYVANGTLRVQQANIPNAPAAGAAPPSPKLTRARALPKPPAPPAVADAVSPSTAQARSPQTKASALPAAPDKPATAPEARIGGREPVRGDIADTATTNPPAESLPPTVENLQRALDESIIATAHAEAKARERLAPERKAAEAEAAKAAKRDVEALLAEGKTEEAAQRKQEHLRELDDIAARFERAVSDDEDVKAAWSRVDVSREALSRALGVETPLEPLLPRPTAREMKEGMTHAEQELSPTQVGSVQSRIEGAGQSEATRVAERRQGAEAAREGATAQQAQEIARAADDIPLLRMDAPEGRLEISDPNVEPSITPGGRTAIAYRRRADGSIGDTYYALSDTMWERSSDGEAFRVSDEVRAAVEAAREAKRAAGPSPDEIADAKTALTEAKAELRRVKAEAKAEGAEPAAAAEAEPARGKRVRGEGKRRQTVTDKTPEDHLADAAESVEKAAKEVGGALNAGVPFSPTAFRHLVDAGLSVFKAGYTGFTAWASKMRDLGVRGMLRQVWSRVKAIADIHPPPADKAPAPDVRSVGERVADAATAVTDFVTGAARQKALDRRRAEVQMHEQALKEQATAERARRAEAVREARSQAKQLIDEARDSGKRMVAEAKTAAEKQAARAAAAELLAKARAQGDELKTRAQGIADAVKQGEVIDPTDAQPNSAQGTWTGRWENAVRKAIDAAYGVDTPDAHRAYGRWRQATARAQAVHNDMLLATWYRYSQRARSDARRQGLRFSDGSPVNSATVRKVWQELTHRGYDQPSDVRASRAAWLWQTYRDTVDGAYRQAAVDALGEKGRRFMGMPKPVTVFELSDMGPLPMTLADFLGGFRTFKSVVDASYLGRQGFMLMGRLLAGKRAGAVPMGLLKSLASFTSERRYEAVMAAARSRDYDPFYRKHGLSFRTLADESGLYLAQEGVRLRDVGGAEEIYVVAWPEQLGHGKLSGKPAGVPLRVLSSAIRGFDRLYSAGLDLLRLDVFDIGVRNLIRQGFNPIVHPEAFERLAADVNTFSRRGNISPSRWIGTSGMKLANLVVFAIRYRLSGYEMLGRSVGASGKVVSGTLKRAYLKLREGGDLSKDEAAAVAAAAEYMKTMMAGAALGIGLTAILYEALRRRYPDARVVLDPTHTDFLRVTVKGRQFEAIGGLTPTIRSVTRAVYNTKTTRAGSVEPLERYGGWVAPFLTSGSGYMVEGLSPAASVIEEATGPEGLDAARLLVTLAKPMAVQDVQDSMARAVQDGEPAAWGALLGAPSLLGFGLMTETDRRQDGALWRWKPKRSRQQGRARGGRPSRPRRPGGRTGVR